MDQNDCKISRNRSACQESEYQGSSKIPRKMIGCLSIFSEKHRLVRTLVIPYAARGSFELVSQSPGNRMYLLRRLQKLQLHQPDKNSSVFDPLDFFPWNKDSRADRCWKKVREVSPPEISADNQHISVFRARYFTCLKVPPLSGERDGQRVNFGQFTPAPGNEPKNHGNKCHEQHRDNNALKVFHYRVLRET
jgi:hypothetical protein